MDSSFDTEAAAVEDNSGSDLPELPAMTRASSLPAHRRGETTALVRVTLTLTLTLPNPNLMTLRRGASETTAFFKSMRAKEDLRAAKEAASEASEASAPAVAAGVAGAPSAAGEGKP